MSRTATILLALAIAAPAFADKADVPTTPKPRPVQQPTVSVTCDVVEVWATHGKGSVDPAIDKTLGKRLGAALKQNDFKQLSSAKTTLTAKKAEAAKLAKGSGTLTLIEIVNKAQARLTVDFNAAKGNSKQTVLVPAGDYVVVSVNQSNAATAEAHVLAVGACK